MALKFDYDNRHYNLEFNTRVIQISGGSAIGKSLMFNDLQRFVSMRPKLEDKVLFVSVVQKIPRLTEIWREFQYIIIDNADLILTPKLDDAIVEATLNGLNYWVIIGREPRDSVSTNSVGVLRHTEQDGQHHFDIDYTTR